MKKEIKCERKCFGNRNGLCEILKARPNGTCSFCKPEREVTNGVRYPYRPR